MGLDWLAVLVDRLFAAPEFRAGVLGLALHNIGLAEYNQLVFGRVIVLDVAKHADRLSTVEGVRDVQLVALNGVAAVLLYHAERVVLVDDFDRNGLEGVERVLLCLIADAVVALHQGDGIHIALVVLVGNREQSVVFHHVEADAGVVGQILRELREVDGVPAIRQSVVVVVVAVGCVLALTLRFGLRQHLVDADEIVADELLFALSWVVDAGGRVLLHHHVGEAFALADLHILRGELRLLLVGGRRCVCHIR